MKTLTIAATAALFASQTLLAPAATTQPTYNDQRQMTRWGSAIMQDAAHANRALQTRDDGAASHDIDDALALRTKLARLAKADDETTIVPLYADLDDTEYLANLSKQAARSQEPTGAGDAGTGASSPVTVTANVGDATYEAIDLDKTQSRLLAAKRAMKNGNVQAAEDTLAAVGDDLITLSVATDLPLLTAREDLALAQSALNAKDTEAADTDLRHASHALSTYAASGPHGADAKVLASQIDAQSGSAATPAPLSSDNVASWWAKVTSWFSHPTV